jgi:hypothetical protein
LGKNDELTAPKDCYEPGDNDSDAVTFLGLFRVNVEFEFNFNFVGSRGYFPQQRTRIWCTTRIGHLHPEPGEILAAVPTGRLVKKRN